jgi:hypothetical protein
MKVCVYLGANSLINWQGVFWKDVRKVDINPMGFI